MMQKKVVCAVHLASTAGASVDSLAEATKGVKMAVKASMLRVGELREKGEKESGGVE